jgi:2-polyprenyl-6-methoxyphenol hydroxylase-like FAD-dependent oxidoreductase
MGIQYAKSFQRYELGDDGTFVTAYFEDGSSASGTVLIGTDGARSAVRSALLGHGKSERSPVPYSAVNLHAHYPDPAFARSIRELNPVFSMGVHPAGCWVWVSGKPTRPLNLRPLT